MFSYPDKPQRGDAIAVLSPSAPLPDMPPAIEVYRVLMCMGERKLLQRFAAIVWGRPRAWSLEEQRDASGKARYTQEQHDAVAAAVAEYSPGVPLVFGFKAPPPQKACFRIFIRHNTPDHGYGKAQC